MLYQIYFYVPVNKKDQVKESMFAAGAGRIGYYQRCSFETFGTGQYEPMQGSQAYQGAIGKLEICEEIKVEMVCEESKLAHVISAMKLSHPYEEVAFGTFPINSYFN